MNAKRITALALALVMTLLLAACGSKTVVNDDGTKTEQTERGVKVTQTVAKAMQTEKYETADFSMTIPKGWTVTTGGTNIYHSIRVSDPNEPLNQMFVLLKADVLLHSQAGKDAWQQNYNMGDTQAALFAKAAVLDNPSTEGFFKIFSQYTAFASEVEPAYSGYAFPRFDNFTVTDRYPSASPMKSSALGDEQLRATFTDNGKEGEGLFAASVVDFGSFAISNGNVVGYQLQAVDGGYYMAYNIVAVTAAKDTFIEWEGVLTDCFKTLQYCSADQPELQCDHGRLYVLLGKPQQKSGHYEPEAERRHPRLRARLRYRDRRNLQGYERFYRCVRRQAVQGSDR